jgi:hypothetical protein
MSRPNCQIDDVAEFAEAALAQASSLSVDGLAERLDDRFSLLGGGRGRRRQRQQTLQTMMDWSYELLDDDELVAQSLVVPSIDSGRYALDRLIAADEVTATRDRHLAWKLTVTGYEQLTEPGMNWQYEIDKLADIDNIVAAMECADENRNPDALLDLFRGSQHDRFVQSRGARILRTAWI